MLQDVWLRATAQPNVLEAYGAEFLEVLLEHG